MPCLRGPARGPATGGGGLPGDTSTPLSTVLQMLRVAELAGVRVSLEKGESKDAMLLLEGFPQGCRRARGIIQVSTIRYISVEQR